MVLWLGQGRRTRIYPLLAQLLAMEYGIAPLPPLARTQWGKPYCPTLPHLAFNISHSAQFLLCGVGEFPLGVDVEVVRARRLGLPRHLLSDREYHWFTARGCHWDDFYALWTLKESLVKCQGTGLRCPAREISVPLLEPGESAQWEGHTFRAFGGTAWRAAACTAGTALPEIFHVS